jgi:hypothetical protein
MLAAAAAPAIVRASSLMPVAPRIWTPPDPYGEVGFIENFMFIEAPYIGGDGSAPANMPQPQYAPALTLELIRRVTRKMKENQVETLPFIVHPSLAVDMRREGYKVAPPGWRPPRR